MPTFTLRPDVTLSDCAFGSNTAAGGRYNVKARLVAGAGIFVETNDGAVQRLRLLRAPTPALLPSAILYPAAGLLPAAADGLLLLESA